MIYEYSDKTPQGCAVTSNYDGMQGRRKRETNPVDEADDPVDSGDPMDTVDHIAKALNLWTTPMLQPVDLSKDEKKKRSKRDVRTVKKFIELALVLDKAMVSWMLDFFLFFFFHSTLPNILPEKLDEKN